MKKLTSLFTLFMAGLMTLFAETATMQYTNTTTTGNMAAGNNATAVGLDAELFTVTADKGGNGKLPGLNKAGQIRLYQSNTEDNTNGNSIIVSITSGTITSVVLNLHTGSTGISNVNNSGLAVYAGDKKLTEADGSYAVNGTSFSIKNENTAKGAQVWITSVVITYSTPIEITSITLDDVTVREGKTATVKVNANGNSALTWTIADETIATVDDKGVVTGVKEGTTTVTATVKDSDPEVKAEAKVTVTAAFVFPAEGTEITCAQAVEIATELGTDTSVVYTVVGYVTVANGFSGGQQTLWLDDAKGTKKNFQSFWGNSPKDADGNYIKFAVDDKVKVTGRIFAYGGNAATSTEIKNGTVVAVEGGTAVVEEVIKPSEAAAIAAKLEDKTNAEGTYTIYGYVTAIERDYSTQYKNQSFWLADEKGGMPVFLIYNGKCDDLTENVKLNSLVEVTGATITRYNSNYETTSGATFVVKEEGDGKAKEGTPVTVAEALAIANALEDNVATETYYTITGIVDEVTTPWEDQYKNSTFYIVDQQGDANHFYAYRVKGTEVVVAGDKVKVSCYIMKYVGDNGEATPENTSIDARYEKKVVATAVEKIFHELNHNAWMYNVLGIQVGKDYKGVVIQNGQKYLVK